MSGGAYSYHVLDRDRRHPLHHQIVAHPLGACRIGGPARLVGDDVQHLVEPEPTDIADDAEGQDFFLEPLAKQRPHLRRALHETVADHDLQSPECNRRREWIARVCPCPWQPALAAHLSCDLGRRDCTANGEAGGDTFAKSDDVRNDVVILTGWAWR